MRSFPATETIIRGIKGYLDLGRTSANGPEKYKDSRRDQNWDSGREEKGRDQVP